MRNEASGAQLVTAVTGVFGGLGGGFALLFALAHAGCGDSAEQPTSGSTSSSAPPPPEGCAPGELESASGCLPAGTQDNGCAVGETKLASGKCLPAGETERGCAPGTRPAGGGCVPAGWQESGCAAGELADERGAPLRRRIVGLHPDRRHDRARRHRVLGSG